MLSRFVIPELVWRRLDEGATQQAVADALGWSRGRVSQFAPIPPNRAAAIRYLVRRALACEQQDRKAS